MGTNTNVAPSKSHIIAFPYPGKGHINPMLHFCNRLTSHGLMVTMIHTTTTVKAMKLSEINSSISIEVIDDGREGNEIKDAESYFKTLRMASTQGLSQLIDKHNWSNINPPKIVLYSSIMPWILDVVHDHGLRGASFFAQSLCVSALYYHMLQGTIIQKDSNAISLPALPPLESNDLPVFSLHGKNEVVGKLLLDQFSNIDEVDYILFNTFNELENEMVCWMERKWPVFTVGPTIASMYSADTKVVKTEAENNEICIKWLDAKETGSVVYVSFGSTVRVAEEQMVEIAQGLVKSGCGFLWVVRNEEESKLPRNFKSETIEKGLIVNWCRQLDVLAHGALACFMTHCGWNSTLEALSLGMPMIAVPQWVDQTTNSKFIADVWHVGLRARVNGNGIVTSNEIERCIVESVKTEIGKNLKTNAIKWKNLAKEAVEGGSSATNIQNFVIGL